MPKQINQYQVGQTLVRMFALKGRYQPVLDETIVPVVNVGITEQPQRRIAAGGQLGTASGAGNQNLIRFVNPTGSGVLVTVRKFWALSGAPATDFFTYSLEKLVVSAGGTQTWRDSGLSGLPVVLSSRSTRASAALGNPRFHMDNDDKVWDHKLLLQPGHTIQFIQDAVNQTFDVWMLWEETDLTAATSV